MNLIFDWAGTLSDTFPYFAKIVEAMFDEFNKKFGLNHKADPEEWKKKFTIPYMKFWNHYFPDLSKEEQDVSYIKYVRIFSVKIPPQPIPGVKETLDYLKTQNHRLFIVSSDIAETLMKDLKDKGLDGYFIDIFTTVHHKDKVLKELIQKHGLKKDETYYIGDSSGDVLAAKKVGIKSVGVYEKSFQTESILRASKPTYLLGKISDLQQLF